MQIAPPFGYKEVVPFLKTQKVRLLAAGQVAEFARRANAIPISHSEFQPASRHYPIVFTAAEGGSSPAVVAVLGMTAGENLFGAEGGWASGTYVPAYARRYPFCISKLYVDGEPKSERVVCVAKAYVDAGGVELFDSRAWFRSHELPELAVPWAAEPVEDPLLLVLNEALAAEIGLDPDWLRSPDGVRLLVGNAVPDGAQPVAQGYAGHQFGGFVPRLGDGRALLLGELTDAEGRLRDVHLKGSGRTPFARGGDGLAAIGPMLREYVVSEAMHALGVPTTRSLAVVATGRPVLRETTLPGAIGLFRDIDSAITLHFLARFPTQDKADWLSRTRLGNWLRSIGYNHLVNLDRLWEHLHDAPRGTTGVQGAARAEITLALVAALTALKAQIKALEKQIAEVEEAELADIEPLVGEEVGAEQIADVRDVIVGMGYDRRATRRHFRQPGRGCPSLPHRPAVSRRVGE